MTDRPCGPRALASRLRPPGHHPRRVVLLAALLVCSTMLAGCTTGDHVRVSGAWALYPLMTVWTYEYPGEPVKVSGGGSGQGVSDVLNGQVDIGMLSRPPKQAELERGMFHVAVVKDSVVAIIHCNNPVIQEIEEQGLSRSDLESIFLREATTWGDVVGTSNTQPIVVYGRSDASGAADTWAHYLGNYTQSELQQHADANFNGDQPIAQGVAGDPNAIGFTNLNFAYNIETGGFARGLRPVPLDQDDDGVLDDEEDFYGDRDAFLAAAADDRYPSPPTREIFLVSKGPFEGPAKEFVAWILTDGQPFVAQNGYVPLSPDALELERTFLEQGSRQ